MSVIIENVIKELLEDEDDFDMKEVELTFTMEDADAWLKTVMPGLGFKYRDMGIRGWEKQKGNLMVTVGVSAKPGEVLVVKYKRTAGDRWQTNEIFSVMTGEPLLMVLRGWRLISESEDDFDLDAARAVVAPTSVEERLAVAKFKTNGPNDWGKSFDNIAITIRRIAEDDYVIVYHQRDEGQPWQVVYESLVDTAGLFKELTALGETSVTEDLEDDDYINAHDVTGPIETWSEFINLVKQDVLQLSGSVNRNNSHYVHERTTSCEINADFCWSDGSNPEERTAFEAIINHKIDELVDQIDEKMVEWNRKIYKELEAAYEYSNSDEQIIENIEANDYDFDENGHRDDDGGFKYAQLDEGGQERAREWYREASVHDDYYAEPVLGEWRWLLYNKGFGGIKIAYSGFWNQGDGASFTCDHIDFKRYFSGPDPLEVPEVERDSIVENLENDNNDQDMDTREVYNVNRIPITHIKNQADYAEYQQRFDDFMARNSLSSLSTAVDENGESKSNGFSWSPCDVCQRPLGGTRVLLTGFNPTTKEVSNYSGCPDCEYYAAFGELDDQTMMEIDNAPVPPIVAESEEDFEDVRDIEPEMAVTFQVMSSHGELTVSLAHGSILSAEIYDPKDADGIALNNIAQFDLQEWYRFYPGEELTADSQHDILDFGFWLKDGTYEPPEMDWRKEQAETRQKDAGN